MVFTFFFKEERTSRIGAVEIVSLIITPLASASSGVLFENIGYYGVFSICVILFGFSVIYFQFYVQEKRTPITRKRNLCVDIFDIKNVITDIFKVIIQKRDYNRRILLILTYVCYILIKGPASGTIYTVKHNKKLNNLINFCIYS